ncbi:MAG: hypothetical protein K6G91_07500 [Kiritimatiellae bacterium]|nr:hypothetical protein [Kiritimatiellia bacterium]
MKKTLIGIAVIAATLAAQATVYRAGLKSGFINSYDGNNYTTVTIPDTGVFASVEAGGVKASENGSQTYPPIWANNRTWRYHGQMYFDGGTYYFAESIDDAAWMTVDGAQILKDATWNNVGVSSAVAPAAGWHDVEIRLGNGTGGAGIPYDTTKDANGRLCGFGVASYNEEPAEKPSAMSAFVFAENTADNSWMRCIEDTSYITLNSIAKTENGYNFSVTMTAPSAADVTVYASANAGMAESTEGWTVNSGAVAFAAGETKTVEVVGTFATPPYFMIYLEGVGTTLEEGDGIKFWEWSDIKKCTMEPVVSVALTGVTGTSGTFDVTLGYDKVVEGMTAPAIALKAYYGAADAGATATGWDSMAEFSNVSAGVNNCALSELTEGQTYYVRFAAKTEDSDWVWSDCLAFATSGPYISAFPASLYENDGSARSFTISRPVGTDAEDLTVYLSYSANAAALLSGLPESVVLPAGELSVTVPFTVVDNETADGNVVVTLTIAENAAYVRGNPASVEMSILDDDSITPSVCVWTGGASDLKWESAANWDPRVPTSVDTAKFASTGLSANAVVTVASEAFIKDLVIETTTAFTLAADENGGSLQLGGITRVDVEGNEGNHTIEVPLVVYAGSETNCIWNVAGANSLVINADISKTDGTYVLKTGAGNVNMSYRNTSFTGPWIIREGQITANVNGGNTFKGTVTIGGGETPAKLYQSQKNSIAGATIHVYTNGTFQCGDIDNGRADNIHVYEGGVAQIGSYVYTLNAYLHGGTYNGGGTYNARNITSYASDRTAVFNAYWRFEGYQDYTINVARGSAPVDLLIKNGLAEGGSGRTEKKAGNGIVKSTVNFNNLKSHFQINAGTWLVDNPGEYGLGIQETTVAAGAKIGGTGCVGMKDDKNIATLALSNGSESNFATLSPGTIDETTGKHVYGTFTAGRESARGNKLALGNWAHLEIGVGPRNSETQLSDVDKLFVCGTLEIGSDCTLDLTTNSADLSEIKGGKYTIVEADSITGTFATVLKPKNSWKVTYVSEEVEGVMVVKKINLDIPSKGLAVYVR